MNGGGALQGVSTTIYAALSADLEGHSGAYLSDCCVEKPSRPARDPNQVCMPHSATCLSDSMMCCEPVKKTIDLEHADSELSLGLILQAQKLWAETEAQVAAAQTGKFVR